MTSSASTASVVVVVIDLEPLRLSMTVPTYLPASDLTQRIARDAGLAAFWPDGTRRLWTLRARGRIVEDDERLGALGVGDGELLWLLPEPPPGSPALERARPAGVEGRGGWVELTLRGVAIVGFAAVWSVAGAATPSVMLGVLPAGAVGVLALRFSARVWGGKATAPKVAATGAVVAGSTVLVTLVLALLLGSAPWADRMALLSGALPGALAGMLIGWLASLGSVDPLPVAKSALATVAEVVTRCGVCGGPVDPSIRAACARGCGKDFHAGCLRARQAVARGNNCAVCGA